MREFNYLDNVMLEEALTIYLTALKEKGTAPSCEEIPSSEALGRVTSEAVYARISSPHYSACAMDGIALTAKRTFGATETTPVLLEEEEEFIRVDTGDPLPEGTDAVVMMEEVVEAGGGKIKLFSTAVPWQHVRQIGEDLCAGEMILTANTCITPASIGAMLAGGVLKINVWKKPRVGLIPTGDEVVSPTENPEEGQILEFNSAIFSSMLRQWGAEPRIYGIVPDRRERIRERVLEAANECDLVVLNAGSSAGRDDYSADVIAELGEVFVHGIAIKPGKPTILGLVNGRPVIGVPGYPVSGIIVLQELVKPLIQRFTGSEGDEPETIRAVLSRKLVSTLKYKEFVRMKLGYVGGKMVTTPLTRGAGVVTSFVKADGILEVPMNVEGLEAGAEVSVRLLKSRKEIEHTLVINGSHDPLVDIVSDIFRRRYPGRFVSSAHVGSMGGIMAVKRGEAHLAGIHLLDEHSGQYNESYLRRTFPEQKITLIHAVKRIQGLMVLKGNPKGITDLKGIEGEGIRYVNRQKGSGTRILLDYLIKSQGMKSEEVYGYDREEYTHMAVAAQIASGSADVGMGIFSAAKAFGLDFIPVCEEQYDFVLPQKFLELDLVQRFIEVLGSEEFKSNLRELGGYNTDDAGGSYELRKGNRSQYQ